MSRLCEYCGSSLPDGAKKCPACGAPVTEKRAGETEKKIDLSGSPSFIKKRDLIVPQIGKNAAKPDAGAGMTNQSDPENAVRTPVRRQTPPRSAGQTERISRAAPQPKKKHRALPMFLAVVFFVELGVAAFKYPGFVNNIRKTISADNPNFKFIDISTENRAKSVLRAASPGNPANITVVPDAKKIAKIKPDTAAVSPEAPVCTAGDITADFGKWNLDEEDTFEVRNLGTVSDEANDCRCVMYDFAMASGKHEFTSGVTITMPRTAGEYDGKVVHYNEELGIYEPTAFEVSEDGKWYTVTLYHFSGPMEVVSRNTKRFVKDKTNSDNINIFSVTESEWFDSFSPGRGFPTLQNPVTYSEEALTKIIQKYKIASVEPKYIRDLVKSGRIDKNYYTNVMLSTLGTGIDIGGQVTGLLGSDFGDLFSYAGLTFTSYKLMTDLQDDPDTAKVIEKDWPDIVSALTTAAGFYPPAAMACAIFGIMLYYIPKGIQYVEDHTPMDYEDAVYRYYLNRCSGGALSGREFLKLNGKGWSEFIDDVYEYHKKSGSLNDIQKEIESTMDAFIETFWYGMSESQRSSVCRDCAADYSYLLLNEPLSAQYYFDMEAGWHDPTKNYSDEYMLNARDILCRNTKDAFEKMAKKYLDDTEVELKNKIYNEILPSLNNFMVFRFKSDKYPDLLESPYADMKLYDAKEQEQFWTKTGKYETPFWSMNPFSLPVGTTYDYEKYPIRFYPKIDVIFKPLNLPDRDFSGAYIPHPNFFLDVNNGNGVTNLLWIPNSSRYFDFPKLNDVRNIIFVCKVYFYLMADCPEIIQIKDIVTESGGWQDCKIERAETATYRSGNEAESETNNQEIKIIYYDVTTEIKEIPGDYDKYIGTWKGSSLHWNGLAQQDVMMEYTLKIKYGDDKKTLVVNNGEYSVGRGNLVPYGGGIKLIHKGSTDSILTLSGDGTLIYNQGFYYWDVDIQDMVEEREDTIMYKQPESEGL